MTGNQRELIEFLGSGVAYALPDEQVTRIETHAAMVFLVGDRAYKMKRAVRYSFLDFSSLARRHQALEAELRLNRRTAPQLYRRLVPVTHVPGGHYAIDGAGPVAEWLLEMVRFDQNDLLDRMAVSGRLDEPVIGQLAAAVVAAHQAAEARPEAGGHSAMAKVIDGNAADLAALVAKGVTDGDPARLTDRIRGELARTRELLESRRRTGFVRHCHGDLHLGNIVLFDGAPVLFDCLEFDDALATIDTYYDLALLLMDLCHRDLPVLAHRLLGAYLDATQDDDGTRLLPLFMAVRATIRAKVAGFRATLAKQARAREAALRDYRTYLRLAFKLIEPVSPRLIAIGGISGTGKSTLAMRIASGLGAAPGAIVLRSDLVRKHLFGVAPTERLGAEAYTEVVSRQVYDALADRATRLLAAGRTVIVDATFLDPPQRRRFADLAARARVPFQALWLTGAPAMLAERIRRRAGDASDATVAVLERQLTTGADAAEWPAIDAGQPRERVAAQARSALRSDPA